MIKVATFDNSLSAVKDFMEDSGFFDLDNEIITYVANDSPLLYTSGTVNSLTIKDASDNILFRAEQPSNNTTYHKLAAYASSSLSRATASSSTRTFRDGISCKNGIIIRMLASSSYPELMIARTNLGKLAFVYDGQGNTSVTNIYCVAWGDVSPLRDIDLKTHVRPKTLLAPLLTSSEFDVVSYTTKAGWMPYNADYASYLRAILINDRRFITDGTYAIEDEG